MKVFKHMTALVLALVMAAALVVTAYAATVTVKYREFVYSGQITFRQYDYSQSTSPTVVNMTISATSSLGSGSALYHVKYASGTVAYCIQPGVHSDDSGSYVQGSSGCWYNLPASVQSAIALALACGYPSADYGTASGDRNSSAIINAEKWAATQAIIWELICEYRSAYTYDDWGYSPFYDCVDTSRYPTFGLWYDEIAAAMQSANEIPSFAAYAELWADVIELKKNAAGSYMASVTDTNGVLSAYNFTANSGSGVTFTRKGNTLTITATAAAAKNLLGEKTYSATGSAFEMDPDEAVLCWYDRTGRYQAMASYTGVGRDPLRVYIKIRAVEEKGSLTINKVDAETGKALAGVTYRLYDSAGKKVADAITGADGKAVFKNLPQGKYSYQEISAPSGYVVDNTKYQITITATALNITAKRTNTPAKASVEIVKVDGDNKTPLQGAGFRLYDASNKQVAEGYTDVNGRLTFSSLRLGSYTYKEFKAPDGYVLDDTAYSAVLNKNGQVLKVTRENTPVKGSIEILKVDADTKQPLAGVVFRLFDANGNKIADGTTDTGGKVTFSNLRLGKYFYQEISTVDGYVLDETRYDFSLTTANFNVKVTRENVVAKGSISVRKVDATGAPLAGAELLLETSADGKTWTEVGRITTDSTGVAKWENLKTGVQYRVTEAKAPAGYTLLTEPLFAGVLDSSNRDVTITACNNAGFALPFTGGNGFIAPIMFAALMLCMGVYFCKKFEMKENTK